MSTKSGKTSNKVSVESAGAGSATSSTNITQARDVGNLVMFYGNVFTDTFEIRNRRSGEHDAGAV